VQAGDVLVSTTRPNLNAVAVVPTQLNGAIVSTGFAVLRPVLLEPRWLFSVVQSEIDQTREAIQAALMECTNLRAALLNYAISGKLVGQHNGDQPAEELLTQIRIEREKRKHLPKQAKSHRKAKMKKLPLEAVKEAIKSLPQQRFTFKELSDSLQVDYDPLKDVVFELLGEAEPVLRQIFDSKAQTMQLERIKL
jgi:hypothetical protein